ncbi:uncharacterized protein TRIADDRAFT_60932 [Trichoplax adhaerens]|uniref:Uncharacterized protein n=1 Tax=Trichoplax adhaerens TaxID=10228 RepID=B3S9J6_TRIAD|nr:predicted protein [Trichoplax adhaerens]EDV20488.1 predicted protein [Trichoplax adhaerens]|eukprot:XP_002116914.1 predicted protein [Trichoplax adhaerens]
MSLIVSCTINYYVIEEVQISCFMKKLQAMSNKTGMSNHMEKAYCTLSEIIPENINTDKKIKTDSYKIVTNSYQEKPNRLFPGMIPVFYADPPYTHELVREHDDNHLIYLSPVIRLEPDGYQFMSHPSFHAILQILIYGSNELFQYFSINCLQDLQLELAQRNVTDENWTIQSIEKEWISVSARDDKYLIAIPIYHFSDYAIYFKSAFSYLCQADISILSARSYCCGLFI